MAKNKKNDATEKELEAIEHVLSSSEAFIEKHQNKLLIGLGVVVVIVLSYLAYSTYYVAPKEKQAAEIVAVGQKYFAQGNYEAVLHGDSVEFDGLIALTDKYSMTTSGNIGAAYVGLAYYKLGEYDNAIKYLNKTSIKDDVLAYTTLGTIGDAYVQKGETQKGIEYFLKAAKTDNAMVGATYLLKAGKAYESLAKYDKAIEVYQLIKTQYASQLPGFAPIEDIDKYIEKASSLK
ncbi:MAG: tetratricopeptide repeat protein [Paludibacteraceae bacterium]|jgi:tetratricopeptide (TPR) repeat protein|nr:tetratricopeptide repeat protein [Paludibacteraceae bacterium]NLK92459.1 tetratricopeptide repeat protein [Bacteroidales bacterium]MBP6436473.1 tetratricopeptide repeat protein [Paludibacteraceae bacterium]MBP7219996.1 tetratricopeptide repeat protein [Paludibacteraceae bacterium]MBP8627924.1 tetratricopeptide repeat protein [Paludibacteraceae bacterium]